MGRGAWRAAVHRVRKNWTRLKGLSTCVFGFPSGSVVKNPPANTEDLGSIPRSGRSPGERNTLAWRIPWTEEPGRLQSMASQESDTTE